MTNRISSQAPVRSLRLVQSFRNAHVMYFKREKGGEKATDYIHMFRILPNVKTSLFLVRFLSLRTILFGILFYLLKKKTNLNLITFDLDFSINQDNDM